MKHALSILLIIKSLPWRYKGGIQTHTWDLAKALAKQGHQVTVLTGGSFRSKTRSQEMQGIKIQEISFFPGRHLPAFSLFMEEWAFNRSVKSWVKQNQNAFDIIHAQGRSGYLLYQIPEIHGKLVQTIHGITQKEAAMSKQGWNENIHTFFASRWEGRMINSSAKAIAVSSDLRDYFAKQSSSRSIEVIPNGVDCNTAKGMTKGEALSSKFVFVGRLHPIKGLIPLLRQIAESSVDLELDIIGSGPQQEEIKRFIQKNHLEQRVRLLGEYENNAVRELLPCYRGLILPSIYEAQGIVLLEANLCGIPVIASRLAAIQETVTHGENGLLCDLSRVDSFGSAMALLKQYPEYAQWMGIKGRAKVLANYSWERIAEQTLKSYYQIAG